MLRLAAFDSIDRSASADSTRVWTEEEEHAKNKRIHKVTAMDIYDIKMERHEFDHHLPYFLLTTGFSPFLGRNPP